MSNVIVTPDTPTNEAPLEVRLRRQRNGTDRWSAAARDARWDDVLPPPKSTHPLLKKRLVLPDDKADIRETWAGLDSPGPIMGFLHEWEITRNFTNERIVFLLELADGHRSYPEFDPECECKRMDSNWRGEISRKAFKMLCQHFFGTEQRYGHTHTLWYAHIFNPKVYAATIRFFNGDRERSDWKRNLPDSDAKHHSAIARTFLFELIRSSWAVEAAPYFYKETESFTNRSALAAMALPMRGVYVQLLDDLDKIDWLLVPDVLPSIDKATMVGLKRFALHSSFRFPETRAPRSIAEAALTREAARVYMLLRNNLTQLATRDRAEAEKRREQEELYARQHAERLQAEATKKAEEATEAMAKLRTRP